MDVSTQPLDGKVAVVTGAGNGLGRAEALALAAAGARLVLNDLPPAPSTGGVSPVDAPPRPAKHHNSTVGVMAAAGPAGAAGVDGPARAQGVEAVASEIRAGGGEAVVVTGDIAEYATAEQLLHAALDSYGALDVLVNNAGFLRDRMVFSMSEQEWDDVIRVHLRGHFVTTRVATAHWRAASKARGGPVYGRIINTSSEAFLIGSEGQPNYAAAKAGIAALTVATARGCARYGVRANALCPRARTAMTSTVFGPAPDGPDPLSPERVAPLVVYLASPDAEAITGQVFVVHGGTVLLMAPPRIEKRFDASGDTWTVGDLDAALGGHFTSAPGTDVPGTDVPRTGAPRAGFSCEETIALV